jgi:hypothetical protein
MRFKSDQRSETEKKNYGLRQPEAGRPLAGITDYGVKNVENAHEPRLGLL